MVSTNKGFYVVAYDITNNKRRGKIVKLLTPHGIRINLSVFECMLTDNQYKNLRKSLQQAIDQKKDHVVIYALCKNCYSKIDYVTNPPIIETKKVVVI